MLQTTEQIADEHENIHVAKNICGFTELGNILLRGQRGKKEKINKRNKTWNSYDTYK